MYAYSYCDLMECSCVMGLWVGEWDKSYSGFFSIRWRLFCPILVEYVDAAQCDRG